MPDDVEKPEWHELSFFRRIGIQSPKIEKRQTFCAKPILGKIGEYGQTANPRIYELRRNRAFKSKITSPKCPKNYPKIGKPVRM